MEITDFANMRSKDILKKLEYTTAPFDPFEIANKMGVKVDTTLDWEKVEKIKDGQILVSNGEPIIWINPLRPENRKKFTLAHELGHLVYDVLPNFEKNADTQNNNLIKHYRNDNQGPIETRANSFAAGLLMPIFAINDAVKEISKKDPEAKTDDYINGLASIFEVSKQAVIIRLKSLGVIPQDYNYKYF